MWTIVIVEDEVNVRTFLKNNIDWESMGFQVIDEAGNGVTALDVIQTRRPDLVLCDIDMPLMNGIELLQRTREARIDSRFVMLTCMNDFEYARVALNYGASKYILKLSMSVESLHHVLLSMNHELKLKADQQAKQMLYEYQPIYQLLWEHITELRKEDDQIHEKMSESLSQALPFVMICVVLHGANSFTIDDFLALGLVKNRRDHVIHPFTVLGHTTFFYWSSDDVIWNAERSADTMNFPYHAMCSPVIHKSGLHKTWRCILRKLIDWRSRAERGVRFLHEKEPSLPIERTVPMNIMDRLEKHLQASTHQGTITDHDEINKIIRFIEEHYHETITLEWMAQLVMMDKYYISGLFKKKMGENLISYLHRVRMKHAKHKLENSDMSIGTVGEQVGYQNDNYFIRVFKRFEKMTPAHYRMTHRRKVEN